MRKLMLTLTLNMFAFTGASLALVGSTTAETSYVFAHIKRTLVDAYSFGGCMAQLTENPKSKLSSCKGGWLTFDCDESLGDIDAVKAYRMFDQAQLALATGKKVRVDFRDDIKADGYCFAYRIDVLR